MAVSKINYGSQTLIDLTNDTVSAEKLLLGVTAHDKAGNLITGELVRGIIPEHTHNGGTLNAPQSFQSGTYLPNGVTVQIPSGYLVPSGTMNITANGSHNVTIYASASVNVSQGETGQITGSNTNGKAFTVPISTIGFEPSWFAIILNGGIPSSKTGVMLVRFGSKGSSSNVSLYMSNTSGVVERYSVGAAFTIADGVVSVPTINSSTKYSNTNYRWVAIP